MRVLHLVKTSEGAHWAARQIKELTKLGVSVSVVLPQAGRNFEAFRESGAEILLAETDLMKLKHPQRYWDARQRMLEIIRAQEPDLIHSHFVGSTMFARLVLGRNSRIPRIFQVPGPLHLENFWTRRAELATAGLPDFWLASSEAIRNLYLKSGVPEGRLGLSYYGIEPLRRASAAESRRLRAELGAEVGSGTSIVGMVAYAYAPKRWLGQTRGLKGHEDLIDAVQLLIERGRDIQLVVVGGPWEGATGYFNQVRAYAASRLGAKATFLGTRSDVQALYGAFDVAVHPSHSENLGGAPESLGHGVPTVTTDVGGFPELVKDGQTGWTVPPSSPARLAEAIDLALGDRPQAMRLAANGRKLSNALFDVKQTARSALEFYHYVERTAGGGDRTNR